MCFTRTRPLTVKTTRAPRTDRSILSIFVFGEPGLTWVLGSAHLVGSPRNSRASHNYAKLLKTGVRWSRVFGNFRNLVTAGNRLRLDAPASDAYQTVPEALHPSSCTRSKAGPS
jgi:hypothetical protein